ncbi:hypothetical protein EUB48_03215 [Rhodoferax sediminis]|uniref:Uncharacterized protein n=2 Tax=Rhodoferax sediminis TaxID=2509614 RepID=A0A515D7T4_9BURK|nr:hypothetical protein EUB48_03215 [Rhodoferax sediminis]
MLLGGGRAHVKVLADLAERPLAGWDVHLVSPYRHQIYSGMLPGGVAGHYPIEACAIALDALAADARMKFHETAALGVDAADNEVTYADGTRLNFDFCPSIPVRCQPSTNYRAAWSMRCRSGLSRHSSRRGQNWWTARWTAVVASSWRCWVPAPQAWSWLLQLSTGPWPTAGRTFASPSSVLVRCRWKVALAVCAGKWADCWCSAAWLGSASVAP